LKILITGGAGFIGCNTAKRFIEDGHEVILLDNLSRKGAEKNLDWLKAIGKFEFHKVDIRDFDQLKKLFTRHINLDAIFHFAAQVAVTTSFEDPRQDLEVNLLGTLNILELARNLKNLPFLLYTSTNKVYGDLEEYKIVETRKRYKFQNTNAISESQPLNFHSPYGCSKGGADQYVLDYARYFGLPTCVFRMSCIYGSRQFGIEDQGWVAWFIIAATKKRPITIYGSGKQTRDVLYIDDLVDAFVLAFKNTEKSKGQAFNVGGGEKNTWSLLELIEFLRKKLDAKIELKFDKTRPGDQKIYISDISKIKNVLGWEPTIGTTKGTTMLLNWVKSNLKIFP